MDLSWPHLPGVSVNWAHTEAFIFGKPEEDAPVLDPRHGKAHQTSKKKSFPLLL